MTPRRPADLTVLWDGIPQELIRLPQWVCWRYELVKGKWTKVPRQTNGRNADSTEPPTWADFGSVRHASEAGRHDFDGVGCVFSEHDEYAGVDLDGCIDVARNIAPEAQAIIDRLNSYTETSPSGTGVKIWVKGRLPDECRHSTTKVVGFKKFETYDRDRYFAMTGRHLAGTPKTIEPRQEELLAVHAEIFAEGKKVTAREPVVVPPGVGFPGTDDELLAAARRWKGGREFSALFDGGDLTAHSGDDSAADLALCNRLAWLCGPDPPRIERLFSISKLGQREKWASRADYRERTIATALRGRTDFYSAKKMRARKPQGPNDPPTASPTPKDDDSEAPPPDDNPIRLGERDPVSRRLVFSPNRTLPTAIAFVKEFHSHTDGRTLCTYADLLMGWQGNRYVVLEDAGLRQRLHPWLHQALRYGKVPGKAEPQLMPFDSNPRTVSAALDTIRSHTHVPASLAPPCWLDSKVGRPSPLELLPCRTLTLHVTTGKILPATPLLFTTNAIDFDYSADPEPPLEWIKFLEQLWEDDLESVQLLQEFMGYLLIADTSQQKMLLLVGPRRSGKGTIGRVLSAMVGAENVVGPTCNSLAGTFGLQGLIGKTVAIVSDARFHGESVPILVERLLCISGEDAISIDRKFLSSVTLKLPTRFVFLTNELPQFRDSSAALAGRYLILRLTKSFYGNEDHTLTARLLKELPGILNWSIDGLRRLRERGRFVSPGSSEEAVQELEDLASPVGAFVRECCIVGTGKRVEVDRLFSRWKLWCDQQGREYHGDKPRFGKDLGAAVPGVKRRRGTNDIGFYEGVDLATGGLPV